MVYKLDHIGITVPSVVEAQERLKATHPCFHSQLGMETGLALREVSIHRPVQFGISLHGKPNSIGIELIEYPKVEPLTGSIFPWFFSPESLSEGLAALKSAVRVAIERAQGRARTSDVLSQLSAHRAFNAVVVAVEDLQADDAFWKALRFRRVAADDEMAVLALTSLLPPTESQYILLFKADDVATRYTDVEGINEIALLCASCRASLNGFHQGVFRTSVSVFPVNGKEISLGYLRSPAGVLAELFSVRIAANGN